MAKKKVWNHARLQPIENGLTMPQVVSQLGAMPRMRASSLGDIDYTIFGRYAVSDGNQTAGHKIDSGSQVSLQSDGLIYPCRVNSVSAVDTNVSTITDASLLSAQEQRSVFLDISDTVKLVVSSGDPLSATRVAITPTTTTSATSTWTVVDNDTATWMADAIDIGGNSVAVAASCGSSEPMMSVILSGLDTTVTVGTEVDVGATVEANGVAMAPYSSTEYLVFFTLQSGDDLVKVVNPTFSGTTITDGTVTTLVNGGGSGTYIMYSACRFGSTDYYMLVYSIGTDVVCRVVLYNGSSSYTVGSAAAVITTSNTIAKGAHSISVDENTVVLGYNDAGTQKLVVLTRSGTVASVGTPVTVGTSNSTSDMTGLYAWDKYTITFAHKSAANATKFYLYTIDGLTPTLLGSALTVSHTSNSTAGFNVMGRWNPTKGMAVYFHQNGATEEIKVSSVTLANNFDTFAGIARQDIQKNFRGHVTYSGYCDTVSGLTAGVTYYRDTETGYSTYNVSQGEVGVAISATEITIK